MVPSRTAAFIQNNLRYSPLSSSLLVVDFGGSIKLYKINTIANTAKPNRKLGLSNAPSIHKAHTPRFSESDGKPVILKAIEIHPTILRIHCIEFSSRHFSLSITEDFFDEP